VPQFKFHFEAPEDIEKTAKVYGILVKDVNFQGIPEDHIYERFGIPKPKAGERVISPMQQPVNTNPRIPQLMKLINTVKPLNKTLFPDQAAIDDVVLPFVEQLDPVMETTIRMVKEGITYEDIMASILKLYPELDASKAEEYIARAIFISDLWGGINVK